MNHAIRILIILLFSGLLSQARTSSENRKYIREHISFYYAAHPNTDTAAILLSMAASEKDPRNVFNGNTNMDKLQAFLVSLLNDSTHGGDGVLQLGVYSILSIRGEKIAAFLYDDSTPFNEAAKTKFINNMDAGNHVFPIAFNGALNGYGGAIHIGQHFLKSQSHPKALFVILHELVHTQDMTKFAEHKFLVGSDWYTYGYDDRHDIDEAIPAGPFAFSEGIADAFAYKFAVGQNYTPSLDTWHTTEREIKVEMKTPGETPLPDKDPDVWMYKQLENDKVVPYRKGTSYAFYHLNNLPVNVLTHVEMITMEILYFSMEQMGIEKTVEAMREYNAGLKNILVFGTASARLLWNLSFQSTPQAMQGNKMDVCTDYPANKLFLYPIALADYFTGYTAKTEADFRNSYGNDKSEKMIGCYWQGREKIRKAIKTKTDVKSALDHLALVCGMTAR